jgi:hypothetical protein
MSEDRTTDMHGFTGERCRNCETTFADCTAGIFKEDGGACCGVCRNTSTHKSDEFTKKKVKDETVKVTVTLTAEQATQLEKAVKIFHATGQEDITMESLIVEGATAFADECVKYLESLLNSILGNNSHN